MTITVITVWMRRAPNLPKQYLKRPKAPSRQRQLRVRKNAIRIANESASAHLAPQAILALEGGVHGRPHGTSITACRTYPTRFHQVAAWLFGCWHPGRCLGAHYRLSLAPCTQRTRIHRSD